MIPLFPFSLTLLSHSNVTDIETIPGPYGLPIIENALNMTSDEAQILGLERLANEYGPIFQLTINGSRRIICSSAELMAELVNEKNFIRTPPAALTGGTKAKGLFAAAGDDPDWGQAHRILVKPMGPLPVQDAFDGKHNTLSQEDIAELLRHERYRLPAHTQMGKTRF